MKKAAKDGKVVVRKLKIINKIKKLPLGKKILAFSIMGVMVLLIAGLIIYPLVFKEKIVPNIMEPEPSIVVVKDNYKYVDGTLSFLNDAEEVIGTYECQNKDVNMCYVAYELNDDNFDETKQVYEDGSVIQTRSKIYYNRYAFVYDNVEETENVILYDFQNEEIIGTYLGIKSYYNSMLNYDQNNYVIIKDSEAKYGVLNLDLDTPEE
ncbi:MAG TPA: hypothetical protein PLX66_02425, partial [Bacilli bacterium]|nr:hypothetical protein [Bacilli bacterium]